MNKTIKNSLAALTIAGALVLGTGVMSAVPTTMPTELEDQLPILDGYYGPVSVPTPLVVESPRDTYTVSIPVPTAPVVESPRTYGPITVPAPVVIDSPRTYGPIPVPAPLEVESPR